MIYLKLFFCFMKVGLFSVGGGYAAMPLIQSQVVDGYGWLSMKEFTDLITIAEMTPGPIAVNSATFVGIRIGGLPGALTATLGCIFPACILVSLLAYLYYRYKKVSALQSILGSLRPAVVALILSAGLSVLGTAVLDGQKPGLSHIDAAAAVIFAVAFVILRKWKWNPILVMCLGGGAYLLLGILRM